MVFITILGAIAVGWVYQSSSKDKIARPELEIPTDIDFFLSQLNYRVFNKSGNLDYQLQSPYLEHFIKDDISRIEHPMIRIYLASGDWKVKASRGSIIHQQEWVELDKDGDKNHDNSKWPHYRNDARMLYSRGIRMA